MRILSISFCSRFGPSATWALGAVGALKIEDELGPHVLFSALPGGVYPDINIGIPFEKRVEG
jgi:hypothetical protein